jgi:hypothetical protein
MVVGVMAEGMASQTELTKDGGKPGHIIANTKKRSERLKRG